MASDLDALETEFSVRLRRLAVGEAPAEAVQSAELAVWLYGESNTQQLSTAADQQAGEHTQPPVRQQWLGA